MQVGSGEREFMPLLARSKNKGKEGKAHMTHSTTQHLPGVSIAAAAEQLGVAPRTIRHWLQTGRLQGYKLGLRTWVVCLSRDERIIPAHPTARVAPAAIRQRLRAVGARLIAVGNKAAQASQRPGALFLTWRAPRSLRITLAIGRVSPTQGWTPYALGVELPFWLAERNQWRRVLPLLRRYDTLRSCCAPWLLRLPDVGAAVLAELARLEVAVTALTTA
jgi:excisionase family DNA binding protein